MGCLKVGCHFESGTDSGLHRVREVSTASGPSEANILELGAIVGHAEAVDAEHRFVVWASLAGVRAHFDVTSALTTLAGLESKRATQRRMNPDLSSANTVLFRIVPCLMSSKPVPVSRSRSIGFVRSPVLS